MGEGRGIAQRREMPKAADKTKAFVQKAVEVANEHAQMFPAVFLEELRKDWQLLGSLSPITLAIQTLAKKLDDTTLQLGGETFAAARTIYSATKTPSANAALRKAADDLAKRYGRRKKVDDTTPTAPPAPPTTTAHS